MNDIIRVGITHGDINGVGYEVVLKALAGEGIPELFTPVVFGSSSIAKTAIDSFGIEEIELNPVSDLSDVKEGVVNILELNGNVPEIKPSVVDSEAGRFAVESLEAAVKALKEGEIDVLVTAPISKEAVQSEGFKFPGHTEYLTARLGEGNEAMMILCNDSLRVALLTVHLPINKVAENITEEKIEEGVKKFSDTLIKDFGIVRPTIAVLSLNPHAGDGGLLGAEEEEIIKPALTKLSQEGILAFGPFPADGFFGHGLYKKFDGVLAMYHDQGLAPFKTIATTGGVNYSAGLPFVRTSPDHGTAYDIAWKGEADPKSMREAIYMAIDIYRRRLNYEDVSANPLKKHVQERPERPDRFDRNQFKNELTPEADD